MEDIPYPYYNQIYVLDHFYLRHNIPMVNDNPINQLEKIYKRTEQISIQTEDRTRIDNFIQNVRNLLGSIILTDQRIKFSRIEEIGPYRKNVMIKQKPKIITEKIGQNNNTIYSDLKLDTFNISNAHFIIKSNEFDIKAVILIGLTDIVFRVSTCKMVMNADSLINFNLVKQRLNILQRTDWFLGIATYELRILVKLFQDIKHRFQGFQHFNEWMIEALLNYCLNSQPQIDSKVESMDEINVHHKHRRKFRKESRQKCSKTIKLNQAFLRAFHLLSSGIFLPDSVSICDPLMTTWMPIQNDLDEKLLDLICCTAQTLLRIMNYENGFDFVIGLIQDERNIENVTIWDGIIVQPSISVFIDHSSNTIQPIVNNDHDS
ncbi:interleukin enhancer-binding factor 2 homolog isoform X2 [Dermatophagoides farinae]|uniref:Interleukin enhancer-binding factor 2 n=1 Tax=Dermatophagoides farinae TaxID=6954 RepID=A0A9D4SLH3_DERFA|nr:interleukin enhancer-binding factor 2 [Dermatophagoides farinae]